MSMEARMKTSDRGEGAGEEEEEDQASNAIGPVRIVHKEHESISAFCVNQVNNSYSSLKNKVIKLNNL